MRVVWSLLLSLSAASCGGLTTDGGATTGDAEAGAAPGTTGQDSGTSRPDWVSPDVDTTPVACTRTRVETETRPTASICGGGCGAYQQSGAPVGATGECEQASDCTDGVNGTCRAPAWGTSWCAYDECFSDDDCSPNEICRCGDGGGYINNTCLGATCRTNADCGEGFACTFMAMPGLAACGADGQFHCASAADECVSFRDCPDTQDLQTMSLCVFDPAMGHRTCHEEEGEACPL